MALRTKKTKKPSQQPFKKPIPLVLDRVDRLAGDGYHCAFTAMTEWRGHYYIAFRYADTHNPTCQGVIRIIRSKADFITIPSERMSVAAKWHHVKDIVIKDGDARDPKFIAIDDRDVLCVLYGVYFAHIGAGSVAHKRERDLVTCASFTHDGAAWGQAEQVSRPNYWLWSVIPVHEDEPSLYEYLYPDNVDDDEELARLKRKLKDKDDNPAIYAAAYHWGGRHEPTTINIFQSQHGYSYTWMNLLYGQKNPTEPVIFQPAAGKMVCMVRLDGSETFVMGHADFPYIKWDWHEIGEWFQPSSVIQWNDRWLASGRMCERDFGNWNTPSAGKSDHDTDYDWDNQAPVVSKVALFEIGEKFDSIQYVMDLPSRGDCAYTGMALSPDEDELLISYYSQHQRPDKTYMDAPVPADVYLAHVKMKV